MQYYRVDVTEIEIARLLEWFNDNCKCLLVWLREREEEGNGEFVIQFLAKSNSW